MKIYQIPAPNIGPGFFWHKSQQGINLRISYWCIIPKFLTLLITLIT